MSGGVENPTKSESSLLSLSLVLKFITFCVNRDSVSGFGVHILQTVSFVVLQSLYSASSYSECWVYTARCFLLTNKTLSVPVFGSHNKLALGP